MQVSWVFYIQGHQIPTRYISESKFLQIRKKRVRHRITLRRRISEYKNVEDENKRLKKELANTKVKLRNSSKDNRVLESSLNRSSLATRIFGIPEHKQKSPSKERDRSKENEAERWKLHLSILQTTNDKIVKENAILRLRLEEIEKSEIGNQQLMHNNKLASNIARRELKILKIYQECADEIKCIMWKRMLPPKQFYSHECIKSLIDLDETIDFDQSQTNLRKISFKDSTTPIDGWKTVKRTLNYWSPIDQAWSDRKGKDRIRLNYRIHGHSIHQ